MVVLNNGLENFGSFIRGQSPTPPSFVEFGLGSEPVDVGSNHLGSGFIRKSIEWFTRGDDSVGIARLTTADAVGSTIEELGLAAGSVVGSDLYTRELSSIGDKDDTFDVVVSIEMRVRRPTN